MVSELILKYMTQGVGAFTCLLTFQKNNFALLKREKNS